MRPTISLLHATYRRQGGPTEVMKVWLGRADRPERVEYIFAMDTDDHASVAQTEGHLRTVNPRSSGRVTSVRNWNAAAAVAGGDLLMVISDDLFPPQGWDSTLTAMIRRVDPLSVPFAVKVRDSTSGTSTLMRHPIVSRAYYSSFGLFSDAYFGLYCDNDITTRAFWRSIILDGRSISFHHENPILYSSLTPSESHLMINTAREREHGKALYESSWPRWKRLAPVYLLNPPTRACHARSTMRIRQRRAQLRSILAYTFIRSKAIAANSLNRADA
jgi:hypothetical protein